MGKKIQEVVSFLHAGYKGDLLVRLFRAYIFTTLITVAGVLSNPVMVMK